MPGRPTRPEKRRAFHESRINAEKNGVKKAWWAAWWLAAELNKLARRNPARAHELGLEVAKEITEFARRLNAEDQARLKGGDR